MDFSIITLDNFLFMLRSAGLSVWAAIIEKESADAGILNAMRALELRTAK